MEQFRNGSLKNIKNGFLHKIQSDAEYRPSEPRARFIRKPIAVAAVIIVLCVAITGTALALVNPWGIIDLLINRREDLEVLPEAADIVQRNVPQNVTKESPPNAYITGEVETAGIGIGSDLVTFSVREAIYDGIVIYITIEVKPSRPDYLLIAQYYEPIDIVENLGTQFTQLEGSIADYAAANDKTMIRTWAGILGGNQSISEILEPDGTQLYIISGDYESDTDTEELEISCGANQWLESGGGYSIDMSATQRYTISVTLENSGAKEVAASSTPVIFNDCGVRVDKVTLTGTAMSIYVEIEYTVIDRVKFAEMDRGLSFELLDENGERLPAGADSDCGVYSLDDNETRFIQKSAIRAAQTLPGEIIMRGYNIWKDVWYETHILEMS